jgi:hypothetical protein
MRTINNAISICLFLGALTMGACQGKLTNKAMIGLQQLPVFKVLSLDSSRILRSQDIPEGQPLVFFLFDPTCSHCQKMTAGILGHESMLKKVRFYFISDSDPKEVDTFFRNHRLIALNNVFVGLDYQYSFFNAFTPSTIPYVAIYSPKKSLSRIFNGEANIDSLIHYTQN